MSGNNKYGSITKSNYESYCSSYTANHYFGEDLEMKKLEQNDYKLKEFEELIDSRKLYVKSLGYIGTNWISGSCNEPSKPAIDETINILSKLKNFHCLNARTVYYAQMTTDNIKLHRKAALIPKLIMGPSPDGSIGIEIRLGKIAALHLNIEGDKITCEVESNGHFLEQDISKLNFISILQNMYTNYEGGYYTERGEVV
jgi:hypothetical protein